MAWYYMYKKDYKNALQYIQECINIFSPDSIDLSPFNNPKVVNETPPPSYMYGLQRKGEIIHDMVIMENADCSFLGEYLDSSRKYTASELEDKIMESGIEANNLALDYMFNMLENLSTQASQLHYLERLKDIFTTSIDLCMKLYNKSNERKYLEQAYGFASNSKSLELLFEKQEKDRITRNAIQDSSYYHLLTMKTQIASMENQIEKEKKQGADSMSIAKLKNELISLRRAYQNGISLFRESSSSTLFDPDFYNPEPLKDLQDKLGRKETIIEFSVSDPNMVVRFIHEFIISSENVFYRRMPLTDSILNHIETVQRGLYAHSSNEVPDDSLFRSLESLYTILIEPVAPYIIDKKVIIIPDEELSWIPFDALVFPGINSDASLPADFLINKYRLSYLNSSRLLPYKQRRMHSRPFLTTIISDYSGYENNSFAALPGAKNEAMEISGIFRSHILNSPSKKEVIRNIEKGDIIHMAMHAEAGIERSQSYILLGTDHNNSDSLHLYDFELGSLSSNARLAVLNACETGSGKYSSGDGIFNMSRSFTLAGIDAVVHSMWEVDDRASLEIMTSFYHNLKRGQDKADALHKARLKYLEQQSPSLTHPVYWAGYQIYGDTQRISFPRWILVCVGIGIIFFLVLLGIYMRKQNMI